jgi:hypothetical protein
LLEYTVRLLWFPFYLSEIDNTHYITSTIISFYVFLI